MKYRLALGIAVALASTLVAQEAASPAAQPDDHGALLERFLSHQVEPVVQYRGTRRLEAENGRFNVKGWMEVTTELSPERGLTWTVVSEGGSGYIRNKVLRRTLEGEVDVVRNSDPAKAALNESNYAFSPTAASKSDDAKTSAAHADPPEPGLARLFITPKRKDMLLVDGALLLAAADADLVQVEGRLSKTPSFWTRSVEVVKRYARVGGIRVPVVTEYKGNMRIAGRSAFRMTYEYQMINGREIATETGR